MNASVIILVAIAVVLIDMAVYAVWQHLRR